MRDGQLFTFEAVPAGFRYFFTNQDYKSWGAEIEAEYAVTDAFRLRGGLGLLDSRGDTEIAQASRNSTLRTGNRRPCAGNHPWPSDNERPNMSNRVKQNW